MIIRCPSCSTTYKVDGSVFDAPDPTFRCSRCKHIFTFQVRLQLHEDESPAAVGEAGTADDIPAPAWGPDGDEESQAQGGADPSESQASEAASAPSDTDPAQGSLGLSPAPDDAEAEPASRQAADTQAPDDDFGETRFEYPEFEPMVEPDRRDARQPESFEQEAAVEDDTPVRNPRRPDFEIDDDFLIPPRRETEPPPQPRANAKGSIRPLVSLVALALFAFVLVAVTYQVNPQPLDSVLRRIPWYGSTVFENRHIKRTLVFESLTSGVQPVMNQTEVFVISGKLVNRNDRSVHQVRIEAQLFDAEGKQVGQQITFVGNAISAGIIQDMTFREISLLQSLKPQSAYRIPPTNRLTSPSSFPSRRRRWNPSPAGCCRPKPQHKLLPSSPEPWRHSFLEPSPSPFSDAVTSISSGSWRDLRKLLIPLPRPCPISGSLRLKSTRMITRIISSSHIPRPNIKLL